MDDDKNLLLSAANAAGIEYEFVMLGSTLSGGVVLKDRAGYWNPLADDGDALRLAVQLNLEVRIGHARPYGKEVQWSWVSEAVEPNDAASTRRAIVRAAAKLGPAVGVA